MKKRSTKKNVVALAVALAATMLFPTAAYATEATIPISNIPYEGEIVTGTGETGNNHTATVIMVDETGEYPGGDINFTFEDLTGTHSKTVRLQEAYYRKGMTYEIYLVAPGTYNVTSDIADGYMIADTLSGEAFTKIAPYGESSIVTLSIKASETVTQGEQDDGSVILDGGISEGYREIGETGTEAEAQAIYQELLDNVSFIATDPTWDNIMNIKGVTQLVYDATIPEGEGKIPFEELSDFDRLIYELTYCCFAPLKTSNGKSWEAAKENQETLAYYTYGNFLNFMPDTGNNREAVNTAFQKLWDWQYAYILEHDEPFNFIANCSYTDMGFGVTGSGVEKPQDSAGLTPSEEQEIKEILEEIKEEEVPLVDKPELNIWENTMDALSHCLLSIGILVVAGVGLAAVLIIKKRKTVEDYTEE